MAIFYIKEHNTILITVSILWWRILTDYQDMSHITTRYSLNLDNSLSTTPQLDTNRLTPITVSYYPTPYSIVCHHTQYHYHLIYNHPFCLQGWLCRRLFLRTITGAIRFAPESLWVYYYTYPNDVKPPIVLLQFLKDYIRG